MSVRYLAVNWNRQKRVYDALIGVGTVASVGTFAGATLVAHPAATIETALIRGLGLTAFLILNLILAIGPASRLDRRWLPLLYNRRHLGVTVAILGVAHAGFAVFQYHALGNLDPIASVAAIPVAPGAIPFEWFGIAALVILFLMAATSHDYWLSVLTPPVWKRLHMLVYPAYLALLFHLGLGFLQEERHPVYLLTLVASALGLGLLHLVAGFQERRNDRIVPAPPPDWVDVGPADGIAEGRARIAMVAGERVAVFRHHDQLSAVSNVCKHQNGPLGEGRIIDGCITCPWHGYQYRPEDGTSPPPFTDSIPTFNLALVDGRVMVDPVPNPAGTLVTPVPVKPVPGERPSEFYVGYQPVAPAATARFVRTVTAATLLLALGLMVAFAVAQRTYQNATFEFGTTRSIEGVVRTEPYPMLEVARPGTDRVSRYILAAGGKHGAQAATAGLDGLHARIEGTLAHRDNLTVLEITSATSTGQPATLAPLIGQRGGRVRLTGEIVDSKCYAGVMNPGRGTTHRACAVRCLAGGLMPLFVVTDGAGETVEMIITDAAGRPLPGVDRLAGRTVRIEGQVERVDDLWFIRTATGEIGPTP
ncbi:MAG: Rieske 2Fe-2S domain-containing protein [Gemmatimonadales bacterium]